MKFKKFLSEAIIPVSNLVNLFNSIDPNDLLNSKNKIDFLNDLFKTNRINFENTDLYTLNGTAVQGRTCSEKWYYYNFC